MTQHSKFSEAAADLHKSNKAIMKLVSDGFLLKREDRSQKDLYIELIAFRKPEPSGLAKRSDLSATPSPRNWLQENYALHKAEQVNEEAPA